MVGLGVSDGVAQGAVVWSGVGVSDGVCEGVEVSGGVGEGAGGESVVPEVVLHAAIPTTIKSMARKRNNRSGTLLHPVSSITPPTSLYILRQGTPQGN